MKILDAILEVFFPDNLSCIMCEKDIYEHKYSMCEDCIEKLEFIKGRSCRSCGRKISDSYEGIFCGECERSSHYFDRGISCVEYNDAARFLIVKFKYHHNRYIGRHIAEMMFDCLKGSYIDDIDFITAVPINRKKERFKGYNHSHIMGKHISKISGKKYVKDLVIRCRETVPLKELTKKEREKELSGAFKFNDLYNGKNFGNTVLLVDDIYTTGTTLDECSRILKKSGYNNIIVMTFSIGNI